MNLCIHTIALILAICQIGFLNGASETDISRLRQFLLAGYDRNSRPIQNHQNATVVKVSVAFRGFQLDERRSIFTMSAWTLLIWEDQHMRWDPKMFGNITLIHFSAHELWQPDLTVYNNLDKSEIDHFGNTRLLVYNTSKVLWVPPTKFQVGCQTNLKKWPYDTQKCTIVLGSWAHDGSTLSIESVENASGIDTSDLYPNREWDVIDTSFTKRVRYFTCCPDIPFPDIVLTVSLARKSAAHTACVVVPGLVIAAAILTAFWLPPGTTQRLSILLMAILINILYLYDMYDAIPNNGDSVPLVLLFYHDSLMMAAFALIWTVCLRYLAATKRDSPVPLPGFVQGFLETTPAKLLCLDPRPSTGAKREPTDSGTGTEEGEATGDPFGTPVNSFQEDWTWLAHLLDRVVFVIYLIVYLTFYVALL